MAKKCISCGRKLSSNLFTKHPLKCDECWEKELALVEKTRKAREIRENRKSMLEKKKQEEEPVLTDCGGSRLKTKEKHDGDKL